jgi:polysaccharide biosynthesis protein VpsM
MKRRALRIALFGASLSLLAGAAYAQTARDDSVNARPRPDFDPEGLYIDDIFDGIGRAMGVVPRERKRDPSGSGVLVMPRLQLGTYYDTNVLRTPNNHRSDVVQTARASLDITSDRDDHGFEFGGFADVGYFARFVSENYHQYGGYAGGFLVPSDETRLAARVSQDRLRQSREETGAGSAQLRPSFYSLTTATAGGQYLDRDWLLAPSSTFKRFVFEPNAPIVLGPEHDRDEWTGTFRLGHSVSEGSLLFIEPQINARRYHQEFGTDGFRHDSSGYQILAGARIDLSSVTYAEFGAGWLDQTYVDPAFTHLSGPTFAGTFVWNPRDWITLSTDFGRRVDESVLPGVSGIESTFATGTLDYEIRDNWLANASLSWAQNQYRGASQGVNQRLDDTWRYVLGTRYLVDRWLWLGASWMSYDRKSTTEGADLKFNQFMTTVSLQW